MYVGDDASRSPRLHRFLAEHARRLPYMTEARIRSAAAMTVDGRDEPASEELITAMGPGRWPYRIIDRSVDQRLEKHALLVAVRFWPHRTFTCFTPPEVLPVVDEERLPPPVPEATGPADLWWADDATAIEVTLNGWPPEQDRWTVRYFARTPRQAADANPTVYAAIGHETVPADWCALCSHDIAPGTTCPPVRDTNDRHRRGRP
ncbi:hypothetical protein [Polymorphospora rubra]|uniref:hypothetical protein n=1 Tax=Polymorphospora rubra TaxID=338584 RepID=UPI0033D98DF4